MVDKLRIESYLDDHYKKPTGDVFVAQINPSTYSESGSVEYDDDFGIDSAGSTPYLVGIRPRTLDLEMVFDATGAVPGGDISVRDRIAGFKKVVYRFEKEIHSPALLWISWGSLTFQCVMSTYSIDYTLFDPAGKPIRAKLKATFEGCDAPDTIETAAGKESADLTHLRQVVAGDTLPLLCAQIYGDGNHYLDVARYNDLAGFRTLVPGRSLRFPPLRVLEAQVART